MGIPRFEILSGVVDGVNNVFFTSAPYTAGSVAVYQNGQLILNPVPEWTETNATTGEITIDPACTPKTGDIMAVFYIDTTEAYTGDVVETLTGVIDAFDVVSGVISTDSLSAYISASDVFSGILSSTDRISAGIPQDDILSGRIID